MTFQEWYDSLPVALPHGHMKQMRMAWDAALASRADVHGGWISVADSKPGHCQVVLVCGGTAYYKHDSAEWFTISGEDWPGKKIQWEVTHWMPLPNPPSNSERQS